jgi:hypothetical protein
LLAIGGTVGAGAAKLTAFDGEAPKRSNIQVWDSMEQFQAYRNSPKFKEIRQIGEKYAKFHSFTIEGVSQQCLRIVAKEPGGRLGWRPPMRPACPTAAFATAATSQI